MDIVVDGHPAYAYTGGRPPEPGRPAVVLIHGGANDHSVWALQSRYLAHHGCRVFAPDLPGHGRSPGPAVGSIESIAAWVLAAMDAAGIDRAALAGHSMGSLAAVQAAATAPDRVTRIALIGTAFPMRVSADLLDAARSDEPRAWRMINAWSHAAYAHYPGHPGPGFWVRGVQLQLMRRQPAGTLYADFDACNRYAAGAERARDVRCPALLILGSRDVMTPVRAGRAYAQAFKDARTVEIAGAGHALLSEAPDEVLDALRDFLGVSSAA